MLEADSAYCPHCGKALKKKALPLKRIAIIAAVIAVFIGAVLLIGSVGKGFSEDTDAINKASQSVVTLYTYDINGVPVGSGSGFAAFEEGIIVTNYHVIESGAYTIEILTATQDVYYVDSVLCYDVERDIAVLYAPNCSLKPLPAAAGDDLKKGEPLTAIGSPIGLAGLVSTGVFSSYLQQPTHNEILFTTSISHGSSGGALFNDRGKVVGVTSGAYTAGNDIYYAIPFDYVHSMYDSRTPADEMSLAVLWEQGDHIYTVDYVLSHPRELQGQEIEIFGYLSAVHYDGYLVSSPDLVLGLSTHIPELTEDDRLAFLELIDAQYRNGVSLRIALPADMIVSDAILPSAACYLTGKVMVYGENNSGTDIRFSYIDGVFTNE